MTEHLTSIWSFKKVSYLQLEKSIVTPTVSTIVKHFKVRNFFINTVSNHKSSMIQFSRTIISVQNTFLIIIKFFISMEENGNRSILEGLYQSYFIQNGEDLHLTGILGNNFLSLTSRMLKPFINIILLVRNSLILYVFQNRLSSPPFTPIIIGTINYFLIWKFHIVIEFCSCLNFNALSNTKGIRSLTI